MDNLIKNNVKMKSLYSCGFLQMMRCSDKKNNCDFEEMFIPF